MSEASVEGSAVWPQRHRGRVVLVTGGAGGLGGAAAERLAAEGAVVLVADLSIEEEHWGDEGARVRLDVTDQDQWVELRDRVLERYGRLDGLLVAHGAQGPEAPVEEVPYDGWRRTLGVNLDSVFLALHTVMGVMKQQRAGRVVLLASISGREGNASMSAYSASKAGVISLAKSVAKEVADSGIVVNAVAPSMFQTRLLDDLSPERNAMLLSRVPMGRVGHPSEFAALAAWLLSDECSYTTGQVFDLTGGRFSGA
ncbi:SDR family NAD(P)-dependent oxidoreductase [Ruicaihuangia caeni]|uniref:SDR family NAD(P)-dependent oxidoreductase n=1 Tax=Ruicaihuangia caeni TaxID=3042517 RepID=UPI00338F1C83